MTAGCPVTCLVGNSACISKVDTPLREQVIALYNAFWRVWDGKTSPLEFAGLGALFIPFFVSLIRAFPQHTHTALFFAVTIGYTSFAAVIHREYRDMRKQGVEEFESLLRNLPAAPEAMAVLRSIEPWRMWLLKYSLPVSARLPIKPALQLSTS